MYPEDWAVAMRLEAALAAAPQSEPTMFDAQFDAHCHVQGASNRQSAPDALREAAWIALESIHRLMTSEDMTYLRGSVALALVEAEEALEDALREALGGER